MRQGAHVLLLMFPALLAPAQDWTGLKKLSVDPTVGWIRGIGSTHYVLFTGTFADGTRRDATSEVSVRFDNPAIVSQSAPGVFQAHTIGIAKFQAVLGGRQVQGVIIVEPKRASAVDFATEVAPIFSKIGCNNANCHGSIKGQNGFKLSLFGYDPDGDYKAIIEAANGRRINLREPENSLILLKPTFGIPHGGGRVLTKDPPNHEYATLLRWIQSGAPKSSAGGPRLVGLEVFPKEFQVLRSQGSSQQIVVVGSYNDGSREDITPKVRYTSSNEAVVEVNSQGHVIPKSPGEATVLVRSLGNVAAVHFGVAQRYATVKPKLARANFIDDLVFEKLARMSIEPSELSSDAEFPQSVDTTPLWERVPEVRSTVSP